MLMSDTYYFAVTVTFTSGFNSIKILTGTYLVLFEVGVLHLVWTHLVVVDAHAVFGSL